MFAVLSGVVELWRAIQDRTANTYVIEIVVRSLIAWGKSTPDDLATAGVMVLSAVEVRRMMAFSDVTPQCEDRNETEFEFRSRRDELRGRRHHRPGRDDEARLRGAF